MLKKNYLLLFIFPLMLGSSDKPGVIKADDLMKRYTNESDTTYVVNFWATWCEPCVKELPDFERINEVYGKQKVKVILVSIDFLSDFDSRLVPFIEKRQMKSLIFQLGESKPDVFINKINPKWQGSIPSTMIINNAKKYSEFFEKPMTYEFLETKIKALEGN